MTHEDLWTVTVGELSDLMDGYRYRNWLEMERLATLAAWIVNGSGMCTRTVKASELVGHWCDGLVLGKMEALDYMKRKVIESQREGG